jgi:selenide, water dikinase
LDLTDILDGLKFKKDPNLLVGIESSDDAGIYKLCDDLALIQTLDFFTPIVNDPYDFGRIAATNALSDVYAMGGKPLTAMNIVCYPIKAKEMDKSVLRSILEGGLDTIHKAGAVLVGGHSVEDPELKYGLSLTGIVHPSKFLTNSGAKPGDLLVLTKPLGTGILATALKARELDETIIHKITELMATLNKDAAAAMIEVGVNACTDITGFGLLGHSLELVKASKVSMIIYANKVPLINEAKDFATMGLVPAGSYANRDYCAHNIEIASGVDPILLDLFTDPQTSGGLLISVDEGKAYQLIKRLEERGAPAANVIGEVLGLPVGIVKVQR